MTNVDYPVHKMGHHQVCNENWESYLSDKNKFSSRWQNRLPTLMIKMDLPVFVKNGLSSLW